MARTKGAVNTSTMLKVIEQAGLSRPGIEKEPREIVKALYERALNAKPVPNPGTPVRQEPKPPQAGTSPAQVTPKQVEPAKPAELTPWQKKLAEAQKRYQERAEKNARIVADTIRREPPVAKDTLVDSTVLEGKTLAQWDAIDNAAREEAERNKLTNGPIVFDSPVVGWASWGLRHWRAAGCPTLKSIAGAKIQALIEKANENVEFAALDEDNAKKLEAAGDHKNAKKKREQAAKKRAKSEELRREAEAIAAPYNVAV